MNGIINTIELNILFKAEPLLLSPAVLEAKTSKSKANAKQTPKQNMAKAMRERRISNGEKNSVTA